MSNERVDVTELAAKRALVAGHADFAFGLVSAVELITGRGSVLLPIQVKGLCGDDIQWDASFSGMAYRRMNGPMICVSGQGTTL